MSHPRTSLVIPSRGGAERLPVLFEALRAQTDADWEAIVVIDGDIDGSEAVVARYRDDLPVRPVVFPENRGRSAALNAGFEAARGTVLVRCDDDLEPAPDYVSGHAARHSGDPVGVVGLYRNVFPPTPYSRAYGVDRDVAFRRSAYEAAPSDAWRFWAGNVSVTRESFDRIGGYDTGFRAYGWEDVDWGYRLHTSGVPVELAPELETVHHAAAATTRIRVLRAYHSGAARHRFEDKHGLHALEAPASSHSPWDLLVSATGAISSSGMLARAAAGADAVADRLPRYVSEKLISLLVESAARTGYRRPSEVSTAF